MSTPSRSIVVDSTHSPHARLRPVPLSTVRLDDAFWAPRLRALRAVTLPSQYQHCEDTGRIDNIRIAAGHKPPPFIGWYFNADVYKWLEAVAWTMATEPDADLAAMADTVISELRAAQQPDGYLYTEFTFERAGERWTNLREMHELYCAGHLIQAAIAHHRCTGSEALMDVAMRFADHIWHIFGPQGRLGTDGHPEIEMAMVELWRETGEERFLELAQRFLDARGQGLLDGRVYLIDHVPWRQLDAMVGHAVRAVYLCTGAADLYAETGEGALQQTLHRLWDSMTKRRMYVNGGLGTRYQGEAFGEDYELPNERAYAETCAAIGSVMWNWRMLAIEVDARYADLMEHTLYNAALPGLGLDGQSYFYVNPLADGGQRRRKPWYETACCPPNIARLLASLPGYFYSVAEDSIWVHLYAQSTADVCMADGHTVGLEQRTGYPWDGDITIKVAGEGFFCLNVRIPGWCKEPTAISVNGHALPGTCYPGSYARIGRVWHPGDSVSFHLPMPVQRVASHPYVIENRGRVAIMRGPLLYCFEQADNPGVDPRDVVLSDKSDLSSLVQPEMLGGVVVLRGRAHLVPPGETWHGQLYRPAQPVSNLRQPDWSDLTLIPYYAWANRTPGRMQVWLRHVS